MKKTIGAAAFLALASVAPASAQDGGLLGGLLGAGAGAAIGGAVGGSAGAATSARAAGGGQSRVSTWLRLASRGSSPMVASQSSLATKARASIVLCHSGS